MADEKLPDAVEVALAAAVTAVDAACRKALGITETYTARDRIDELRLAIHRFAREREAAALERCVDAASNEAAYVHSTTSSVVNAVRFALSPQVGSDNKDPANGG